MTSPNLRAITRSTPAVLALALCACAGSIEVRTIAAPEPGFTTFQTYRFLPGPARRDGRPVTGTDDPMVSNSIANRAIRDRIAAALQDRGYVQNEASPDFAVAFYATAREKLDVDVWDYGYPFWPRWRRYPQPRTIVSEYLEGSVVIDIVDPRSRELLWRGEGRADLRDDLTENIKRLSKVAAAIVEKVPRATPRPVATPE